MHQLTYRSKAKPAITQREIQDIWERAQRNNLDMKISGCLIFHNDIFIQIIEGEEKDVLSLFSRIESDIRHSAIQMLWEGSCTERVFHDWYMAYHSLHDKATAAEIKLFENNLSMFAKTSDKPSAAVSMFWKNVNSILISNRIAQ